MDRCLLLESCSSGELENNLLGLSHGCKIHQLVNYAAWPKFVYLLGVLIFFEFATDFGSAAGLFAKYLCEKPNILEHLVNSQRPVFGQRKLTSAVWRASCGGTVTK